MAAALDAPKSDRIRGNRSSRNSSNASVGYSEDNLSISTNSRFDGSSLGSSSASPTPRSAGERPTPRAARPRRSSRHQEDDDFHKKWEGLEKREEKTRAELLGVTQPRLPKATLKKLAKGDPRFHDPESDDPLQRATLEELETMALDKSKDVTSDLRNVLKIARDTEDVGAQTLENLHRQGEQISRTQNKASELDQELSKGEKLLGKLGPMFSFGWKPKKGKKITGSTYTADGKDGKYADRKNRKSLLEGETEDDPSLGTMDKVKKEMNVQDEMLDEVSASLDVMKNMATDMGDEIDKQDKGIEGLTGDVDELNGRLKQANQRGKKLLGK